jgi:hypothetical protein
LNHVEQEFGSCDRYSSGSSRNWVKTKCVAWKRANANRHKLFEDPKKPPAPTENERTLERKRAELARVRASLARPGLGPGLAAASKAQEKALLWEIEELEANATR